MYLAPPHGAGSRRNFAKMFDTHNTRMTALSCGEETTTLMSNRFNRIPERDGQTDGRTDRRWLSGRSSPTRRTCDLRVAGSRPSRDAAAQQP